MKISDNIAEGSGDYVNVYGYIFLASSGVKRTLAKVLLQKWDLC